MQRAAMLLKTRQNSIEVVDQVLTFPCDEAFSQALVAHGGFMNFLAIDFETANNQRDSACSIGLVKVKDGVVTEKVVHLIRPPSREFIFTYIHGLKWSDVAAAEDFGKIWSKIQPLFVDIDFLAAHNASFDKGVLQACCQLYKIETPKIPFQCSMQLARKQLGIYPTKLSDVCSHLKIELNHHEALSDAHACAQIVLAAGLKLHA